MLITILSRLGILICGISGVIPTLGILLTSGISGAVTVGISKSGITGRLTAVIPGMLFVGAGGSGTGAGGSEEPPPEAAPPPYG